MELRESIKICGFVEESGAFCGSENTVEIRVRIYVALGKLAA
jgi:hypothetical protein